MAGPEQKNGDDIIANINVTPLVDIMLVLLIIFMLVSTFMLKEAIEVELPHAATGAEVNKRTVSVIISKDGGYFVGNQAVAGLDGLRARMAEEKQLNIIILAVDHGQPGILIEDGEIAADESETDL